MNINQPHDTLLNKVNHDANISDDSLSVGITYKSLANKKRLIDLSYLADTEGFSKIQTVFIDNYECDGDLILEVLNTNQKIICKANKQGYFPILTNNRSRFNVYHTGSGEPQINLYFLNFIISQGSW